MAGDAMTALAIFVKTPGLSPIKTRLAAGIGAERAEGFYRLAVQAVAEVAQAAMPTLTPYWAVAEAEALDHTMWSGFPTVAQAEGGLGERLDHVYRTLLERHGAVLLIGADAPQVTADLLLAAALKASPFVMGRAEDGGFWLFGGTRAIERAVWFGVPYSMADTADRLLEQLSEVAFVTGLRDVDRADDLAGLRAHLAQLKAPVAGQVALAAWLSGGMQGADISGGVLGVVGDKKDRQAP